MILPSSLQMVLFILSMGGGILVASEPRRGGNGHHHIRIPRGRRDAVRKRESRISSGVVPTTGKIWPPYPFAEQGFWARKSGFYGQVPEKLRDYALPKYNGEAAYSDTTPYIKEEFVYDYAPNPFVDPYSGSPSAATQDYFSTIQSSNSVQSLNSLGKSSSPPPSLPPSPLGGDPYASQSFSEYNQEPTYGFEENPFYLSSSGSIPPGRTYYRSLDLRKDDSNRIFLRKEDVYFDKSKYPVYYKPLEASCHPYC